MNFLVSKNPVLINHFWNALLENGESLLLSDFPSLLWRAKTSANGLVLVDTKVDGFTGMHELASLKRTNPDVKILIIAIDISTEDELSALSFGAVGSCQSNLAADKILQIFTTVQNGGVWISSSGLPHLLARFKRLENISKKSKPGNEAGEFQDRLNILTHREREIVDLVAGGDSNKVIANKLNITDRTVKTHLSAIFQKLKVNDRLQLALLASKDAAQ